MQPTKQATKQPIQSACRDIRDCDSTANSMYGTRIRALVPFFLALAIGCGDNASPCSYTETSDGTNDVMSETTGLTLDGHAHEVCGNFDPNHFTDTLRSADDDRYRVTVSAATPVLIDVIVGDGVDVLTGVTIRFWSLDAQPQLVGIATYDPTLAGHGAFIITLPPADYDMVVSADAVGALQGDPITYRVRFATMPACDETTDTASHTETNDTAGANDTVGVDFTKDPSFTAMSASAPEATSLGIEAGNSYSIAGMLDDTPRADQYLDRDTYEFTTDDSSNELAVRVTWPSTTSDVDFIIFEADSMKPVVASNLSSDTGPELAMFAVKPSTKYWLWIGDFIGSTATSYRATVCGNHFFY
ncbi:MAG TPA: hypothetical protein VFQ65_25765 [Kofleriaceae bacterium]|nr:hypothetical protein [Kofleriaceae bacterium]